MKTLSIQECNLEYIDLIYTSATPQIQMKLQLLK